MQETIKGTFSQLSEEEKKLKAFDYALMHAQGFLMDTNNNVPELEQYRQHLKEMIDWLAPYVMPMFERDKFNLY